MKKMTAGFALGIAASVFTTVRGAGIEQRNAMANCAMMQAASSANSQSGMNTRGEKGMGFSQTATQHHFFLTPNGGAIQVEVKNPADSANRDNIRMHLRHIAQAFASGDFNIPMFVHDTVPPGVEEMKKLRKEIHYSFEESPSGGRVVLVSTNPTALEAIHKFLVFQIQEHKTGDSTEVMRNLP